MPLDTAVALDFVCFKHIYILSFNLTGKFTCLIQACKFLLYLQLKKPKQAIPAGDSEHPCYQLLSVDLLTFEITFFLRYL